MAFAKFSGVDHYTGLSSDTKPSSDVLVGSTLIEEDTGHEYQFGASGWFPRPTPILSTNGKTTSVQYPFPVDGDRIYAKDIKDPLNDIGTFTTYKSESGSTRVAINDDVETLFTNLDDVLIDDSANNPKWFEFFLESPVNNGAFNINASEGDFSNVKIILKNRQDTSIKTIDDSTNNTKFENHPYPFTTTNYCCIRVEFHTADTVSLSGVFVQKNLSVVIDSIDGFVSLENSTLTSLGADEVFMGGAEDSKDYGAIQVALFSDVICTFLIESRATKTSIWRPIDSYVLAAGEDKAWSFQGVRRFVRTSVTCGPDAQGVDGMDLQTMFKPVYIKPSSHPMGGVLKSNDDAEAVKAGIAGFSEIDGEPENVSTFRKALKVDTALVHRAGVNQLFTKIGVNSTTLSVQASVGATDIDVVSAISFNIGNQIILNGELFHFHITNIVANNIQLDRPIDNILPIGTTVRDISNNMAVLGSLASPVSFKVQPPTGDDAEIWQITRVLQGMTDGSAMDDGKFGGIPALTNGAVLRAFRDGQFRTGAAWKTNGDMALDMFDLTYTDKAPAGENGLRGRWTFTKSEFIIELNGANGDFLEILIQDDTTANTSHFLKAQGRIFGA